MRLNKIFTITAFLFFCVMVIPVCAQTLPDTVDGFLQWVKEKFGEYELTDEPLADVSTIYGVVLDQHGNPVVDADVYVQWAYVGLDFTKKVKEVILKTDSQGNFVAKSTTDNAPSIDKLSKKGYEYTYEINPFFKANSIEQEKQIEASKETPIRFYMRKMGQTTYLFHDDRLEWYFDRPEEFVRYDIFVRGFEKIDRDLSKLENPNLIDLIFDATKLGNSYTLRILAPIEIGGLQMLEQLFYEAPADGYVSELNLSFQVGDEMTKYLYFKSRNPAVYSRMEVEFVASEEDLTFRYDTWTNPYGSRNLEYEPNLPFSLRNQLRIEATEALKNGKLAPEPNL